jgi:hypothetical protein
MKPPTLSLGTCQPQLEIFVSICKRFPRWFRRPEHRQMLSRMLIRIIGEEANE